jgi:hypothetical protein
MRRIVARGKFVWPVATLVLGLVFGSFFWPQTPLHTTATHSTDTFAIATGTLDGSIDAIFCLDYLTGDLTGFVLSRAPGTFGGMYRYNVMNDFGVDPSRNPKFLMVTGLVDIPGGAGQLQPSRSVVYVAEITTGQLAAYAVRWNRPAWNAGRPVADTFVPMGKTPLRAGAVGGGLPGRPAGGL